MEDKNVILLLWALPIALSLHVFEEFIFPGGLMQWMRAYKPDPKSAFYICVENATGIVATLALALRPTHIGLCIYAAIVAIMAANSASHIVGTIQKRRYCPGTISSIALLLPLFAVSYWYLLSAGKLDWLAVVVNVCIGVFFGFYIFGVNVRKAGDAA
ncbi:MAG TPA: HXXEE domain-containing protein [Opitutaceae bacterium]|nr:HXXEE domain-containing protein [Opitutaceae bacterium]